MVEVCRKTYDGGTPMVVDVVGWIDDQHQAGVYFDILVYSPFGDIQLQAEPLIACVAANETEAREAAQEAVDDGVLALSDGVYEELLANVVRTMLNRQTMQQ